MTRNNRATQRARILGVLTCARGEWVPLPAITECAAQYNARIFELRRMGFRIVNRTKDVDGVRHSWFKLETGPVVKPTITTPPAIGDPSIPRLPLFDGRASAQ